MSSSPNKNAQNVWETQDSIDFLHFIQPAGSDIIAWIDSQGNLSTSTGFNFSPPQSTVAGTITGLINGSNTIFNLPSIPTNSLSLVVYRNGVYQLQGTDYTLSGTTLTMTVAPQVGDILVAY